MKTNLKPFGYKFIHINRPIIIGAVYRTPSTTAATDARLELNMKAAYLRNQEMHVLGDFNINFGIIFVLGPIGLGLGLYKII